MFFFLLLWKTIEEWRNFDNISSNLLCKLIFYFFLPFFISYWLHYFFFFLLVCNFCYLTLSVCIKHIFYLYYDYYYGAATGCLFFSLYFRLTWIIRNVTFLWLCFSFWFFSSSNFLINVTKVCYTYFFFCYLYYTEFLFVYNFCP